MELRSNYWHVFTVNGAIKIKYNSFIHSGPSNPLHFQPHLYNVNFYLKIVVCFITGSKIPGTQDATKGMEHAATSPGLCEGDLKEADQEEDSWTKTPKEQKTLRRLEILLFLSSYLYYNQCTSKIK